MIIYKYYNVSDITLIKKILKEGLIKFCSPNDFNDPFDCRFNLETKYSETEYRNYLFAKGLGHVMIDSNIDLYRRGQINILNLIKSIHNNQLKEVGIFCTATKPTNILMWSHYANKHTGICIGYKTITEHNKNYLQFNKNDLKPEYASDGKVEIEKVKYTTKMPKKLNILKQNNQKHFWDFLISKSTNWKYEQEYRCIILLNYLKNKYIHIQKECIAEVVIGLKTDQNIIDEVLKYINSDQKIYRTYVSNNKYELILKKI